MIESIRIADVASYGNTAEEMTGLSQFNYVLLTNCSVKNTISRIIVETTKFPSCSITWIGGTRLQPMVYNRDFVEMNFNPSTELKGVFTLGEKQFDTLNRIVTAKSELDALTTKIETLTKTLQGTDGTGGKKAELTTLEAGLKEKCWAQKLKHDAKLQGAFEGYRNNQERFKSKVLQEFASNSATLLTQSELEKKAESVFGPTPTAEAPIGVVDTASLVAHETNSILKKRVIGRDDVDIADMIKKLGNSDWVREGREFYGVNDGICPFCQQSTSESFAKSLSDYFDETFVADSKAIDDLVTNYATDAARLQQELDAIIAAPSRFLEVEKLKIEKALLDSKITINTQRLAGKKKETSQVLQLESLSNVTAAITTLISTANSQIASHNSMVANLATERSTLTGQIWKFVIEELRTDLDTFRISKDALDKAFAAITTQLNTATEDKTRKESEIRELEKQTTSVQPTIDAINQLLASFGFQGFKLSKASGGTSYKLVRPDGRDAQTTLSEGEKAFVTFLYFYHLLKGSISESGLTTDRIVVFDDPVSSLDSEILFIVGSLIKELFAEVRAGTGYIKQIFVFTHNVYFHKEVTYNPNRTKEAMKEETFWIVRKPGLISKIEKQATNPIKTSYEFLWAEVRNADRSHLGIQNKLRRILEHYFRILGGISLDDLCAKFEGKEKMICKSLCSWVNEGSHSALDDLYVSIDDSMVDKYLKVFRDIFTKSDHLAHYRMMMGDAFVEEATVAAVNKPELELGI